MKKLLSLLILGLTLFTSCKKDFDDPTIKVVATGNVLTIAEVRALYQPGKTIKIAKDISVYGVVTMDESTGNLYKESYITDGTGNLYLRFTTGSGLYVGDSIRVNLNGAKILKYNQMLQVDSLHPDNSVVKLSTQNFQTPEVVTITSLLSDLDAAQGKLVQIDNVFFSEGGQGLTFADGETQTAGSRYLFAFSADDIEIRTSGYSNFADDTLPSGVGKFIGIVAQYNNGLQLIIRDPLEIEMYGKNPSVKTFNDENITSKGWTTQIVTGPVNWETSNQGSSSHYASITNFDISTFTNYSSEVWLVSPTFNFSNSTNPSLSFKNASKYSGANLEVYISTNYDGTSSPALLDINLNPVFTWTPLQFVLSPGDFEWISSGVIDLSSYLGANTHVAFKYTGTSSDGKTWEIDNIVINK